MVTGQNTLVLLESATTIIVEQKFLSGKSQRTGITCTCTVLKNYCKMVIMHTFIAVTSRLNHPAYMKTNLMCNFNHSLNHKT